MLVLFHDCNVPSNDSNVPCDSPAGRRHRLTLQTAVTDTVHGRGLREARDVTALGLRSEEIKEPVQKHLQHV